MPDGTMARCLPSVSVPMRTVSKPKNSLSIQQELAEIQKTINRLWASSDLKLRARQAITSAMPGVGCRHAVGDAAHTYIRTAAERAGRELENARRG